MNNKNLKIAILTSFVAATSLLLSCNKNYEFNKSPKIVTQPKDLIVLTGDTNDANCLSVEATDPEGDALKYKWYIDSGDDEIGGIIISEATKSTYIPDKSKVDSIRYFVSVSDKDHSTSSNAVTVWVVDSLPTE